MRLSSGLFHVLAGFAAVHLFPVGERRSAEDALHGIAEHVRVVMVLEAPLHLFEAAVQVLDSALAESADDGPFEQRPDALDAVDMHVPDTPFLLGVIDGTVPRVLVGEA